MKTLILLSIAIGLLSLSKTADRDPYSALLPGCDTALVGVQQRNHHELHMLGSQGITGMQMLKGI